MAHTVQTTGAWTLCLTHREGQPLDLCWPWPASQARADLAQVLSALGQAVPEPDDMAQCQFHLTQGAGPQALALQHACTLLRCSLNARVLPPGQWVYLQHGDVLEVGLCRWQIQSASESVSGSTSSAPASAGAEPLPAIELTQLAPAAPSVAGAPDALTDLLGSSRWADEEAHARSPAVQPLAAPAATESAALDELVRETPEPALQAWHALYLRRLQSPQATLDDAAWSGVAQQVQHMAIDALEELKQQAPPRGGLSELLGEREHINTVLAQLDASGPDDLLALEVPVNVMHLFAPEGWQAPDLAQRVPSLNRREHHGVALDSALPLPQAQPEQKDPP